MQAQPRLYSHPRDATWDLQNAAKPLASGRQREAAQRKGARDGKDGHGSSFASVEEDCPQGPLARPLPASLLGVEQVMLAASSAPH